MQASQRDSRGRLAEARGSVPALETNPDVANSTALDGDKETGDIPTPGGSSSEENFEEGGYGW